MSNTPTFTLPSAAHPGIQPGHTGHLRRAQSARHARHPGWLGWYCGCGSREKEGVRASTQTHILQVQM